MADHKPLKILILSHSSELGGAERSMLDLFDYWVGKGLVEPHFIIRRPLRNMAKELKSRNWDYTSRYYGNWSQRNPSKKAEDIFRNAAHNTKAIFAIEKWIATNKPDLIMTNTIVSPWAAIAAYFQRVPHIWFVREYGDIDHQHIFELGRKKMLQDIDILSKLVVTNSKTLAKHISQYIPNEKIRPLYTPFNLELLERKSLQKTKNPFNDSDSLKLVITGRISPSKGQQEIASAVGILNQQGYNTELCVIGLPSEPQDANSLKEVIDKYQISDKVHLIGQQPNPLAIIKHADVGIMASRQEAFGRVTFEYMSIGRPVVGSNSGATPEMIINGKNGFLYTQGNVESLLTQLLNYAKDRTLVTKHGDAARQKAVGMMKSESNADALFERLVQIVNSKQETQRPLNFSHRWLEYPGIAQKYIKDTDSVALYRLAYLRTRHNAKLTILWILGLFDKKGRD